MDNIRNFCIIAHIDHGKSTLADRFLELTSTLTGREMKHGQMLDSMELEQERGITIKLAPVRMHWEQDGKNYIVNLIDTPGHVDFSYEVSRSLACCEGAVLLIDASQGIQAQTLANAQMAIEQGLEIIAVLNKIDLPAADPERIMKEIENVLAIPAEEVISISAKEGTNIDKVLEAVVNRVPPPKSKRETPAALIFDSVYDPYRGIVAYVRVFGGTIRKGDKLVFLSTHKPTEVLELGYFIPKYVAALELKSGEIGYVVTGMKDLSDVSVGDTLGSSIEQPPLEGYKKQEPYVFAGIFSIENEDYTLLREALEKLKLNDASLSFDPETSEALGNGFRCGFLGLLHMDIIKERIEREYNLDIIITSTSVAYRVIKTDGELIELSNPAEMPDVTYIREIQEPWMKLEVISPKEYIGAIMSLCQDRRGMSTNIQYLDESRAMLVFEIPLASIVTDFYDKLKSATSGYASMNYEFIDYLPGNLVKLDILVAAEPIDALSLIVHKDDSRHVGLALTKSLKEIIPRHNFEVPIQAAIGGTIIARETLSAMRKNVTEKLYGGDRTRKDKLLKKQKAGKKRMKKFGRVDLPQEAFLALLKK